MSRKPTNRESELLAEVIKAGGAMADAMVRCVQIDNAAENLADPDQLGEIVRALRDVEVTIAASRVALEDLRLEISGGRLPS